MDTTLVNSSTISSEQSAPPIVTRRLTVRGFLACVIAALFIFTFLNLLFLPKYASSIFEGSLIGEYYGSEKQHELIIIGDCEVYENISPITLWEEFGITTYIRGSAQQLTWQSYYLLEDTLRYEKPKVVLFSVLAMKYGQPQSEAYNRLTLDGMRLSWSKLGAVRASMTKGESILSYFIPLLRYHDRWRELSADDFRYLITRRDVAHNGFMMRADTKPLQRLPTPPKLSDYTLDQNCFDYLDKMRVLCEENGIELVLIKSPSLYPHWYPEWDEQVSEYASRNGLLYVNTIDEVPSLDFAADTYDGGLHLNLWGAEKFSKYLGALLCESYDFTDNRSDEAISAVWSEKTEDYERMKAAQLAEIETFGKVITLTKE